MGLWEITGAQMTLILNFHGIGECSRPFEEGEEPYWISEKQFQNCLDMVQESPRDIMLTFDDGNASDHDIALPELSKRGLPAIFFVLAGKIDRPGYLSEQQIRNISEATGMRIGSHGMDHRPWPELDNDELDFELGESKKILEGICQSSVDLAGLPFGRYNRRVLNRLKRHGYTKIYSSDGREKLTRVGLSPRYSLRSPEDFPSLDKSLVESASRLAQINNEFRVLIKSHI